MDDSMIGKFITEQSMDEPMEMGIKPRPKLHRFVDHDKPIHYLKELGASEEGTVYHVIIEGKEYALKLFLPWEWKQPEIKIDPGLQIYASPFANECRAFARLQSIGENGTWAVKCHGWMKLSDAQRRPVARRYGIIEQGRWAIIKDYLPNPVQLSDCQELVRKKDIFRRALICVADVQPRNFRGSFMVDLGACKTYPYIKQLWWDLEYNRSWEHYERSVTNWEVDEVTGEVVRAGLNARRKKYKKQAALLYANRD